MNVPEFYESIGGDYTVALSRLMKDSLIERFVSKFPSDPSFAQLEAAVADGRWDDAFPCAHTLKGVALNLSFAKLGASAATLTDALRPQNVAARNDATLRALFETVKADYTAVVNAIAAAV